MGVLAASASTAGCSQSSCTEELRAHQIAVTRDLPTKLADVGALSVESCVRALGTTDERCETLTVTNNELVSPSGLSGGDVLSGRFEATADGTRLVAQLRLLERGARAKTVVTVRVNNAAKARVVDVDEVVEWEDEECHPKPSPTSL